MDLSIEILKNTLPIYMKWCGLGYEEILKELIVAFLLVNKILCLTLIPSFVLHIYKHANILISAYRYIFIWLIC